MTTHQTHMIPHRNKKREQYDKNSIITTPSTIRTKSRFDRRTNSFGPCVIFDHLWQLGVQKQQIANYQNTYPTHLTANTIERNIRLTDQYFTTTKYVLAKTNTDKQ